MVLRVLSLGGGTQSCALALMSASGELPRLDHVVFADTGGELPETYAYLEYLTGILEKADIPLHIVTAGDLYSDLMTDVPTSTNPTPPAHVRHPDGTKGRINQYRCSYDYKRRIIVRKVKALCGPRGVWKRSDVEQWIGFSLDEVGRMKQSDECRCGVKRGRHDEKGCAQYSPWQTNVWPLIDLRMRREDTIRWFGDHGHPTPPRSACYFCPNSSNDRWQTLKRDHPDLWEKACLLDETIRNGGGFNRRGSVAFEGELYVHETLVALRSADTRTRREVIADLGQLALFEDDGEALSALFDPETLAMDCTAGVCFT